MISTFNARLTIIAAGFAIILGVVASIVWFNMVQESDSALIHHTLEVENELSELRSLIQQAETGQRGFLLTSDEAYLVPYQEALQTIDAQMAGIARLIADNPEQQRLFSVLKSQIDARVALLRRNVDRQRGGQMAAAVEDIRSGQGRQTMEYVRTTISQMSANEDRLLAKRQPQLRQTQVFLLLGIALALVLTAALAWYVIRLERRQMAALLASRDALAFANEKLIQEATQRAEVEQQLRHSQKMEAIGQLTGGIAHDFNNMLAIVMSSMNIVKRRLARGQTGDIERFIDAAREGVDRAAALTQRLLAFARQQPLSPEPLDANKFVAATSELLRRTLGENVRLETILAGGLWRTHADSSHFENALINLAVNARDAMLTAGRLTIETANAHLDEKYAATHAEVTPGQYVMIAVTDTGTGMPAEVAARAFDPFFTTKPTGKGTGLGLSQVYGFVKQSKGHIKIYSEPGQGTTVKIYLPRFLGPGQPKGETAAAAPPAGTGQTVLVVEDEERVRQLTVEMLRELGYGVLDADSAVAALRVLDAHPEVQVLFTDIIMPDVNGRTLADEALRRQPSLKVLYTTGYTRNAIVHNGVLDPGVHLISKPFSIDQLAVKLREVLAEPRPE